MDTGPRSGGEIAGHHVICHPREVETAAFAAGAAVPV
jgi:hypothetical protein